MGARNSTLGRASLRDTSAESERKVSGSQSASGRKLVRATDVFCFVSAWAKDESAKRSSCKGLATRLSESVLASPSRFNFLFALLQPSSQ